MYESIHAFEMIVYVCSVCYQPYGKVECAFECCKDKKTATNSEVKPLLKSPSTFPKKEKELNRNFNAIK